LLKIKELKVENDKPKKEEKPAKAPRALRKPIKEKAFEKRFLKYIEHKQDKVFFESCFVKQEDKYIVKDNLTKADVKKLKDLYKWIKKNRKGAIKFAPLIFAGAVVAAIVIFFTTFANPLLARATEKGLEAIFEAKSDVTGFRLSLVPLRFEVKTITVANKNAPMKNLFEMGRTTIRLKTEAVLRGKCYIEEISAAEIRFGTDRKTSGELPYSQRKKKEKPPKEPGPPLIDLANFDAMALLNQEFEKLATPKLYDTAIAAYNDTYAKWQGEVESSKKKVEELQTAAVPLRNINVNNMRDIETIRSTVQDLTTMINTVQSASDSVQRMVGGIESDINMAKDLEQSARNALTDDINLLKSYVDLGSGSAFAALEPFIRDVLSDSAEQYLDYGLIALDALEKLKANAESKPKSEPKPKKQKKVVFKGRDVNFPVRSYPKFYLGKLASDFTIDAWKWEFDLQKVSSNPDLTDAPVTLMLGATEVTGQARYANFNGKADFRSRPQDKFDALVKAGGFPFSLGDQLSQAGIGGFSGVTDFSVNMTGHNDGGISAGGDVIISKAKLLDPKGTIAIATAEAVSEAGNINLGLQYTHNIDGKDDFKITSNIVELLTRALRRIASAYAEKAMQEIERLLRAKIEEYIGDRFASKEQVDALFRMARGDMTAVNQIKDDLNKKKNELEQKIRGAADQAAQQAKDEATRQGQQAAQDILKGQTPSIQTPSLPSGSNLRLPGR
jgi:uncharacterized protein (TIGR03545 family)